MPRETLFAITRLVWALLGAALLVVSGIAWTTYQEIDTGVRRSQAVAGGAEEPAEWVNVLLIGLTTRRDLDGGAPSDEVLARMHAGDVDRGGYNANTMILLRVPLAGGAATGYSLPRDNEGELLGIPGGPQRGKIKEAYGRAKDARERELVAEGVRDAAELEWLGREAGRRAQVETVSAFLDVPVHQLAELSLVGFYELAQALGGIDVCLNSATKDEYSGADFPAGPQRLDAAQALAFVRQRHGLPNSDLDRTRRQQAFLTAVLARVREQGLTALGPAVEVARRTVVLSEGWDVLEVLGKAPGFAFSTLPIGSPEAVRAAMRQAQAGGAVAAAAQGGVPCVD